MIEYSCIAAPDLAEVEQIRNLYRQAGWWDSQDDQAPRLIEKIIRGSHCFVVARERGEIIGMGRAISDGTSDAYIQDVMVRDTERGRGIGTAIVGELVGRLHDDGLTWIGLIATGGAWRLYREAGFAEMPAAVPMLYKCIP